MRTKVLRISGEQPSEFKGSLVLPASKSYLHRAFFASSLVTGESSIINCGQSISADVRATIRLLSALGVKIRQAQGSFRVNSKAEPHPAARQVFVGGSGTTARLGISFACLAKGSGSTTIVGDESLSRRPMKPLLDALSQLGVVYRSRNGYLPVSVKAGGIQGGKCKIDGSMSSQFISSLLIACTKARECTIIRIRNPSETVSEPYIDATLRVLASFGFEIRVSYAGEERYRSFKVLPNQESRALHKFSVPGDMSSAAVIIGATLCASGRVELRGVDLSLPQPDSVMMDIAKSFGARIERKRDTIVINSRG